VRLVSYNAPDAKSLVQWNDAVQRWACQQALAPMNPAELFVSETSSPGSSSPEASRSQDGSPPAGPGHGWDKPLERLADDGVVGANDGHTTEADEVSGAQLPEQQPTLQQAIQTSQSPRSSVKQKQSQVVMEQRIDTFLEPIRERMEVDQLNANQHAATPPGSRLPHDRPKRYSGWAGAYAFCQGTDEAALEAMVRRELAERPEVGHSMHSQTRMTRVNRMAEEELRPLKQHGKKLHVRGQ